MSKPIVILYHRPLNNFGSVRVSEEMGDRANHPIDGQPSPHNGIDLVPSEDLSIFATHNGTVTESRYQVKEGKDGKKRGWGNYVTIRSKDKSFYTRYSHLADPSPFKKGQLVFAGNQIGTAGKTGGATGVHLHFEILDANQNQINPRQSLAAAFPEFTSLVEASGLQGDLYGDQNDNTLVGNAKPNYMYGLAGKDTYYLPTLSDSDIINDIDSDGVIVIGNGSQSIKLSGNALPKTDDLGNVIEGSWTLNGFDLHASSSGTGLVICKAGADVLKASTGKVMIQNFPFSNSRGGFGITLGKTKDLSTDASGNVISKIGYDTSTKSLPTQQYFYSRDFAKTSDDTGFFGFIAQASDTPDSLSTYKLRIGNFDYAGNKVGEQELSEFPITVASAIYFQKYQDSKTGEDAYLVPFESDYRDSSNIRQSKVGFCLLNKSGQKLSSQVVASNSGDNKLLFAANIATSPDQDYFYLAYVSLSNGLQSSLEQKISRSSLEKVGDPYLISGCCPHPGPSGSTVIQFSNGNVITISQSASALLSNSNLNLQLPKLRDLTPAEIIPNQNIASGVQATDPSHKTSILAFTPNTNSKLEITPNPNSVLTVMGMDSNPNAQMSFAVADRSQVQVYATDSSQYSLDDLLAGKFDFSGATQVSLPNSVVGVAASSSAVRKLESDESFVGSIDYIAAAASLKSAAISTNTTNTTATDDYYTFNDDATYNANITSATSDLPTISNQPFTVILLPNNQTVILVGVNATELAKTPTTYFLTAADVVNTNSPSSRPSGQPSTQPSNDPSSQPSSLPSSQPSSQPSSFPSHHPTAGDLIMPSSIPSGLPSGQPSSFPSAQPSRQPFANPSAIPSYRPQAIPSFNPTGKPSGQPSPSPSEAPIADPSTFPTSFPTSQPSEKSKAPSNQPTILVSQDDSAIPTVRPTFNPSSNATSSNSPTTISPTTNSPTSNSPTPESFIPTIQSTTSPTNLRSLAPSATSTIEETNSPTIFSTNQQTINSIPAPTSLPTTATNSSKQPSNVIAPVAGGVGAVALVGMAAVAVYKWMTRGARVGGVEGNYHAANELDERVAQNQNRGGGRW